MAEYAEYQQNNMDNFLHFNYGIDLFPHSCNSPIKKNTPVEALSKLKKLLRSHGFAFLAGKVFYIIGYTHYVYSQYLHVVNLHPRLPMHLIIVNF